MNRKSKKSINQLISKHDDSQAASIVCQCREIMHGYPTVTKMKACYNLMYGVFNLFKIQGSPKNLRKMAKDIHDGLLEGVDE